MYRMIKLTDSNGNDLYLPPDDHYVVHARDDGNSTVILNDYSWVIREPAWYVAELIEKAWDCVWE